MSDWLALVERSLEEVGGRSEYVPGAKLHAEVKRRASEQGDDFNAYLRSQGISFRQFLGTIRPLSVHIRPGSDMLVGFDSASLPAPPEGIGVRGTRGYLRYRDDAYNAFTRISPTPCVYLRSVDRFATDPGDEPDPVAVPPVTLEGLIERRRAFLSSLDDPTHNALAKTLDRSPNPLSDFQRAVVATRLSGRWHDFNYKAIRDDIETWAKDNDVDVFEAWFSQATKDQPPETPQQALLELARHMTDEEIRGLAIPFRAVEEMYRALPRKRRP